MRFSSSSPPERKMIQLGFPDKLSPELGNENVRASRLFLVLLHIQPAEYIHIYKAIIPASATRRNPTSVEVIICKFCVWIKSLQLLFKLSLSVAVFKIIIYYHMPWSVWFFAQCGIQTIFSVVVESQKEIFVNVTHT